MRPILAGLILLAGLSGAFGQASGNDDENALAAKANTAMSARNWPDAEVILKRLTALAPTRFEYQKALGDAQGNLGHYQDAVTAYDRTIRLISAAPPDNASTKAALSGTYTAKANMLLKLKKDAEAIAALTAAVTSSANPGVAYFNLCAVLYNMGKTPDAAAACDKSIAADPTRADAYFIKGSALFGDGTIDKSGKFIPPAGALPALQKYLALAPDGPHAADVKAMLEAAGVPKR